MESDSSDSDIDIRVVLGRPVAWDGRPTGDVLNIQPPPYRRRVHSKSSSYQGPAHTNTLMTPPDSPQSDLITYYNAFSSNFFASDPSSHAEDPLHFLDESLFFVDQVESSSSSSFLPPGLGNAKVKSPSRDKKRIQFTSLLNDCHQHRMSTIAESDATSALEDRPTSAKTIPSSTKEVDDSTADDSDEAIQRRKSKSNKRVSWASSVDGVTATAEEAIKEKDTKVESIPVLHPVKPKRASVVPKDTSTIVDQPQPQPQQQQKRPALTIATLRTRSQSQNLAQSPKQGLKKLLDYIVPYPTRPPPSRKPLRQQQQRRGRSASLPSRILSDSEEQDSSSATTSSTGRSSESTLGDGEEWVLHGFFEIRHGEMVSTTTREEMDSN